MNLPRSSLIVRQCILAGVLLLSLSRSAAADESGWTSLFDGTSLNGWKASENPASFRVVDGAITTDGPRAHLFYVGNGTTPVSYENFELTLEVMTKPNANSGVYFHTSWLESGWPIHQGFEVQVDNSQPLQGSYIEHKRTGSLYGLRNVYPKLAQDNEWFTLNVVVRKPRVEIRVNGVLVVDYVEPAEPFPSNAPKFNRVGSGAFALQAHDRESHASFRNIRVRALPPTPAGSVRQPELDPESALLLPLAKDNFPLVDLNFVFSDNELAEWALARAGKAQPRAVVRDVYIDEPIERALARSRASGVGLGVVARDIYFPGSRAEIDETIAIQFLEYIKQKRYPVFLVLSPSDRNGVKKISPATRAKFDCVIADAATFTPATAARPDPQAFMDWLVAQTVEILTTEPVDVYATPTLLPIELVSDADKLWTEARMQRIIDACVAKGVAIEINTVRVLPSEQFIRLAKAAGAKFSIGSGKSNTEVLDRAYAWEMQQKVGLTWRDMYAPGHAPTRAQRELAVK